MDSRHLIRALFHRGSRAFRLLGFAGLALVAASVACGELTTSDLNSGVRVAVDIPASSTPPESRLDLTISVTDVNGKPTKHITVLNLVGDNLGTVTPSSVTLVDGKATATFKAGATEGTSTIQVKLDGKTLKTVAIKVSNSGATTNSSPGKSKDEFPYPLSSISWDEPAGDVGAWPITAKMTEASVTRERLTTVSNASDVWPHVQKPGWSKPSIGNYWVIGKCSDGVWHAATVDWVGVGRTGMETPGFQGRDDIHGLLSTWRPRQGEEAYLMLSTHARGGVLDNNRQRTQIVRVSMYE